MVVVVVDKERRKRMSKLNYDPSFSKYSAKTLSHLVSGAHYRSIYDTCRVPEATSSSGSSEPDSLLRASLTPALGLDVGFHPCRDMSLLLFLVFPTKPGHYATCFHISQLQEENWLGDFESGWNMVNILNQNIWIWVKHFFPLWAFRSFFCPVGTEISKTFPMSITLEMKEIEREAKCHKYVLFIDSSFSHHGVAGPCTLLPSGGPHNEGIVVVRRDKPGFYLHCLWKDSCKSFVWLYRLLTMFGFS